MEPKTKTILFVILSFILGGIGGALLVSKGQFGGRQESQSREKWQKMFAERLQLDTMQRAKVDSVVDFYRSHMDVYRKGINALRDTTRMEIRKILSAEQNKRFDEFIKEMDERGGRHHDSTSTRR